MPYHNKTHAADVCQTVYYFLKDGGMIDIAKLSNLETTAMIIASACHDFEHS